MEAPDTLRINLDTDIVSADGNHPTAGTVTVHVGDDPIDYSVTFTITSTVAGTMVDIVKNDAIQETASYPWDEFEALLWPDAEGHVAADWERQASFGYYIINFYFYQVNFVADAITLIEENDTVLPAQSVPINGDTFPGAPPDGHGATGTLVLSCTAGNAGPGSDFREDFTDFWMDDPSDDMDNLYDGSVDFVGFLESIDDSRDVITSIGFVPNSAEDPGGVFYDGDGLTVYETKEAPDNVFEETAWYSITGRYSIMFFERTL